MMTALEDAMPPLLKEPRIKKQSKKQEAGALTCGGEIQNKIKDIHELLTNIDKYLSIEADQPAQTSGGASTNVGYIKDEDVDVLALAMALEDAEAAQILLLYDVYNFIMIFLFTKGPGSITTKPAKDMNKCNTELKNAVAYFNDPSSITPSSPFVNNFKIKLETIGYKKMSNNKIEYKTSSFSKFLDEYIKALSEQPPKNYKEKQTPNMFINLNRLRYRFEKDAPVSSVINNFSF